MVQSVISRGWLNIFHGDTYSATPVQLLKDKSVTAILVLSCLPLDLCMSILAHEVFVLAASSKSSFEQQYHL